MTNEELVALIKQGNNEYCEQLYNQNKGIIYQCAKKFFEYAEVDDLMQEGYIALIMAVNGFNETLECKFITYLTKALTNHFQGYYARNSSSVRISYHVLKQISDIQKFRYDFIELNEREPARVDYIKAFNLTNMQLDNLFKAMKSMDIVSLNETVGEDNEEIPLIDMITDGFNLEDEISDNAETQYIHDTVHECVNRLEESQCDVIRKRYFDNMTLAQIAKSRKRSIEAIRNIEKKAKTALFKDRQMKELYLSCYDCYSAYHYSFGRFENTRISSTEYIALKHSEMNEQVKQLQERERRAAERDRERELHNASMKYEEQREQRLQKKADEAVKAFFKELGIENAGKTCLNLKRQ